jgi:hypothetical protein
MTDAQILNVEEAIIVTLPGTNYAVTYPKQTGLLVHIGSVSEQDSRTTMTPSEFLNRAYDVALTRARDLGWL